jgi:hypothetical protein
MVLIENGSQVPSFYAPLESSSAAWQVSRYLHYLVKYNLHDVEVISNFPELQPDRSAVQTMQGVLRFRSHLG